MRNTTFTSLIFIISMVLIMSCEGPKGPAGADGQDGVDGINASACLAPCHNTGGIWEQYRNSSHFAEILNAEEQESFTGGSCGKCHAKDGLASRLDGTSGGGTPINLVLGQINYLSGTVKEANYDGDANFAQIQCMTCHEAKSDSTNQHVTPIYVAGNFPIRTSTTQGAYLEKSSAVLAATGTQLANYGTGNICFYCHKSRKDVTDYIKTTNVSLTSRHWGPHEGPGGDLYAGAGKGGYEFTGKTYANSTHVAALSKACITCHMPGITENTNYPSHDFKPKVESCAVSGCHPGATDIASIQSTSVANLETLLKQLQDILNTFDPDSAGPATAGILSQVDAPNDYTNDSLASSSDPVLSSNATTRFDNIYHDAVRMQRTASFNSTTGKWTSTGITTQLAKDRAGALYNYFLVVRSKGYGYHNYKYAAQLIYDSIEAFNVVPTGTRPL
jgi:cytochrome c551/c552